MVRKKGVEPPQVYPPGILSLVRLPTPPLSLSSKRLYPFSAAWPVTNLVTSDSNDTSPNCHCLSMLGH